MIVAPFTPEELKERAIRTRKLVTWLIILAIVMFFAGLTSAYVVSKSSVDYWVNFTMPRAFLYSTGLILISSVFAQLALEAAKSDRGSRVTSYLAITLVLGLVFSWFQFKGWRELEAHKLNFVSEILLAEGEYGTDYSIANQGITLVKEGEKFFHPDDISRLKPLNADMAEKSNGASQYFHVLTRAHFAHVTFGLLSLLVMVVMALKQRYTAADHAGLWSGVIYWHFLGVLWVYLLSFLVFVH
jgi:cytochrome c oxidase subunit III